jgi:hypothetical protein
MHEALARFLARRENRLARTIRAALSSAEAATCVHLDRHVLTVSEARMVLGSVAVRRQAVAAAIELARRWNNQRWAVSAAVSTPVAIVEDEWLAGDGDPAPPHVYVCIAARADACQPVPYGIGRDVSTAAAAARGLRDCRIRRGEVRVRYSAGEIGSGVWYFLPAALDPPPEVSADRWHMQTHAVSRCPVESVRPMSALAGDDAEDTALLGEMRDEALAFLVAQPWCRRVTGAYWGDGIGGVVAVFLFEFDAAPGASAMVSPAWCVVGDLPSLLLPCRGRHETPVDVLERYCGEMERWSASVLAGERGAGCAVVAAAPTVEHAEMLQSRVSALRDDVMPQLRLERA